MSFVDELDEIQLRRLQVEWSLVVALRETLDIAMRQDNAVTYRQALNLGEILAPPVLGKENRILMGSRESQEARLFAELAQAESSRTGTRITREELINREIVKLSEGLENAGEELSLAEARLENLRRVLVEVTPKKFTEHRLIIRDALQVERNLPVSDKGDDYREYELPDDRALRIRILHPDQPEHKLGADLIYEFHDPDAGTARVAFVQYKLWKGRSLLQDDRMDEQLEKMRKIGCDGLFCSKPETKGNENQFRFPHCAMFLRPTDSLQRRDSRLISTGLHIPLCIAKDSWTPTGKGGTCIRKENVTGKSVDHGLFEDLFYGRFLGSREVDAKELEKIYKDHSVLDGHETIVIHSQEFPNSSPRPKMRKLRKKKAS